VSIEKLKGRPGDAFKQGPIGIHARQDPYAEQSTEQQPREILRLALGGHRSLRLRGLDRAP